MKTVAIVQARMDSQRLPGKALETVGGRTILEWVLHRTAKIAGLDQIVVATSNRASDVPIAVLCNRLGIAAFCGSADDVLDRYYRCATLHEATHILRVTADCPLLDPNINHTLTYDLKRGQLAYIGIVGIPDGFHQEAFTSEALELAWENATDPYEREHVVPWMIKHCHSFFHQAGINRGGKYSIDTADDLAKIRRLYAIDNGLFDLSAAQIIALADSPFQEPPLQEIDPPLIGRSRP